MSMNDPISDMFTRIRNAHLARKKTVSFRGSKAKNRVLQVLKDEGFIRDYFLEGVETVVELKYEHGQPVIREINRVSRPGRRVYADVGSMPKVYNGLGICVVSTSKGVMTDHQAREANVGGEVIGTVY